MTAIPDKTAADPQQIIAELERKLDERTSERDEALERQTATADILKVIASSPTDVQPVFEAIATSSNRLIGGFSTAVLRFIGDELHLRILRSRRVCEPGDYYKGQGDLFHWDSSMSKLICCDAEL